jgi:N-acetylglucosamine-6-sulfatase
VKRVPRRALAAVAAALLAPVVSGLAAAVAADDKRGPSGAAEPPPNFVVIMTDDQAASTMSRKFMPRTDELLVGPGTVFENFVVTTPVCCPSRASFYTGQYVHNNKVFRNHPGYRELLAKDNTLPTWLQNAGYRTALVGKFMHGYADAEETPSPATPAPGFTDWYGLLSNNYYRYRVSDDGEIVRHGGRPNDYATTVINERSVELIREFADGEDPFFLHVSHVAPHSDRAKGRGCDHAALPAPRDFDRVREIRFPNRLSVGEHDVSDKPSFIRRLRRLTFDEALNLKRKYRCRAASLYEVDRGVRAIVRALERTGELDSTVIALTGDNGYFLGEHRLRRGKGLAYEEAIRQPLVMRVPPRYRGGLPRPRTVSEVAANIDLAPTLLELAGAEPCIAAGDCRTLDGHSLMPLLKGRGASFERRGVLIEYGSPKGIGPRKDEGGTCHYDAIRTREALYAVHKSIFDRRLGVCVDTKEVEHYDLDADPLELENLFPPDSPAIEEEQAELESRLDVLHGCAGTREDGAPESPNCE